MKKTQKLKKLQIGKVFSKMTIQNQKGFVRPEGCTCEIVGTEIKLCPKCKKRLMEFFNQNAKEEKGDERISNTI